MLTNTAPADPSQGATEVTATTIAIEDAEQRFHAALRDIEQLAADEQISASEVAALEAQTIARFTAEARDLEHHGRAACDPADWARYEDRARQRDAAPACERRRAARQRGLSTRARALRERQMGVVVSARVNADLLRLVLGDDDEDRMTARLDLAAAGLL
jgi:hypothetical protein